LEQLIDPFILYALLAVGGIGVAVALPWVTKKGVASPQPIGGLIAAISGGLVVLILSVKAGPAIPNFYFYVFSVIGLGGALRVISHPRPVYAALYFILTILASAGLYVILAAEFLAFALVIVYAGAILITYLFVIMLAMRSPTEDQPDALADYDKFAREPLGATVAGFVLLGVLTTLLFRGVGELPAPAAPASGDALLEALPGKVEEAFRTAGTLDPGERVVAVDAADRAATLALPGKPESAREAPWPEGLEETNVEGVGYTMLARHPGSIEIAGVILLMAMLGAVVLARKQVQLDEEAKARHAARLAGGEV